MNDYQCSWHIDSICTLYSIKSTYVFVCVEIFLYIMPINNNYVCALPTHFLDYVLLDKTTNRRPWEDLEKA